MKKAFTLIELLVVVLIIGVLTATVLPKYRVTIVRGKVVSMVPLLRSLWDAQERYYLDNNKYTPYLDQLDVQFPANCKPYLREVNINMATCGADWFMEMSAVSVGLRYCPSQGQASGTCYNNKDLDLVVYYRYSNGSGIGKRDVLTCKGYSTFGRKVCNTFKKGQMYVPIN